MYGRKKVILRVDIKMSQKGEVTLRQKLSVNLGNFLLSLSEIIDTANPNLHQHQLRTAFIALKIAEGSKLEAEIIEEMFAAALLHDIGAISVEEKVAIYEFDMTYYDLHCIRGEMLLNELPSCKNISEIVRNHHRHWRNWDKDIDDPVVISSQILCLADYIERSIDKNKYILHQKETIVEKVKQLEGTVFNEDILGWFMDIAIKEEFWLDLMSPRLHCILVQSGPYRNREVGLEELVSIGELFRHLIDFKSSFTATHTAGVAACVEIMAKLFGLTELEVGMIKIAGNFHDLGKLVIPDSILEKPGKLSNDEFSIIKSHTYYTHQVLSSIDGMERIADWASYHHEKLDGTGYPFHCEAKDLDTGSRMMAVSDIFVALLEERPYRKSMGKEEIYKILKKQGEENLIDIKIVNLLFDNYDSISSYVKSEQIKAEKFYTERFLSIASQVDD